MMLPLLLLALTSPAHATLPAEFSSDAMEGYWHPGTKHMASSTRLF